MIKSEKVLRATHGSPQGGGIKIGDLIIPCYVLENGVRVLSGRGMQTALKLGQTHGSRFTRFLANSSIKSFIPNDLAMAINKPIKFIRPGRGGVIASGFEATTLTQICDAILQARKMGKLNESQLLIADQCEIITRVYAHIGIIAHVDEATGYQEIRDKDALQKILDKYLLKEYATWAKRFPDEFYELIFKLKGWPWKGRAINPPQLVGRYTNDIVYQRLAPNVLEELQKRNPKDEKGNRKAKHQQYLTEDIGHPALNRHLHAVIAIMRLSANWGNFMRNLARAFPKMGEQIPLALED